MTYRPGMGAVHVTAARPLAQDLSTWMDENWLRRIFARELFAASFEWFGCMRVCPTEI